MCLNNKSYIMLYYPLTYDDIIILVTFFIKISCIFVFLTNIESVIYCYFMSQFLKQSNKYINFYFKFRSTSTFKDTKFLLPQHSEHWKMEQYQGSDDHGELDFNSDVNWPDSGKLWQSTTVSSQCERLPKPWTWRSLYFDRWYHFKKRPGIS